MTQCHCGHPLHYLSERVRDDIENAVERHGPDIVLAVGGRSWTVQRHWLATHPVTAQTLPAAGFPEVTGPA